MIARQDRRQDQRQRDLQRGRQVPAPRMFAASSISDDTRSSADFVKMKM